MKECEICRKTDETVGIYGWVPSGMKFKTFEISEDLDKFYVAHDSCVRERARKLND